MTPRVVVVAGPTASGKSALAVSLAEALNGVAINADSIQCYRDLSILTARPSAEDEARVPHRLFGFLNPTAILSATAWADMAANEIKKAESENQLPIVVGGTGFYLKALMEGLADIPAVPDDIRAETQKLLAEIGPQALHLKLAERDPVTAAKLKPADKQRVARAWEVLEATGTSLAEWQAQPTAPPLAAHYICVLIQPGRDELYAACDARFEAMLASGALDQVRQLRDAGIDLTAPVMRALGAAELAQTLSGDLGLRDATAQAKAATRQYAKRQTTWFRHQFRTNFTLETKFSESLFQRIFPEIRRLLLTS